MTKRDAINEFMKTVMPVVRELETKAGVTRDMPMRRGTWNAYVDALHRVGEITEWQANNWGQPEILETSI
jgi:hypothetical protein